MRITFTNSFIPKYRSNWLYFLMLSGLLCSLDMHSQCVGGQVLYSSGLDRASLCLEDAQTTGFDVYNTSFAVTKYAYALTDINNQILSLHETNNIRFDNLIEGVYYIYGFSYLGDITANLGDGVYSSQFSTSCWQVSYNRIEVNLASPKTNEIRTLDFQTEKFLCLNQGEPDFVSFQNIGEKNTPFTFIVTDDNDRILNVTSNTFADFSNFPTGICRIYGLAYTGNLLANFGMQISETLSTGCFEVSSNSIEVNRALVNGGDIFTQNFTAFNEFVTDDGQSDRLDLTNSGSTLSDYTYVLTDAANNVFRFLDEPTFDFEGLSAGTYRLWGFSYSGDILLSEGQSIFSGSFSSGCFARSFNAITITARNEGLGPPPCTATANTIAALTETSICLNAGIEEVVTDADMLQVIETSLILTDASDIIQVISQSEEIDIFGLPAGAYFISQITHDQAIGLLVGANTNNLLGCFAISNLIPIQILDQDEPACQENENCTLESSVLSVSLETVCIEDPDNNIITFNVDNLGDEESGILITDSDGIILALSADRIFQIDAVGVQTYYHINYESTVGIFGGTAIGDLEGCFALSDGIAIMGIDNCFTEPCDISPSTLITSDPTSLCTTDESDNNITITANGSNGNEQLFLLTRQGETEIISTQTSGEFTFTSSMSGSFNIYLLDFEEPFQVGSDIFELEGCFALSAPILISNLEDNCMEEPSDCLNDGGQIVLSSPSGVCGSDGQNDILDIDVLESGGSNRVFLVVNELGQIVNIAAALVVINNPFPAGNYNIYALSYEDFPAGLSVNQSLSDFPDVCLSNSVQITVSNDFCDGSGVRGGSVTDDFGQDQIKFCTDVSGEIFTVNLDNTGSIAFPYSYIETDENNIITNILNANSMMYTADPTEMMNARIWGVSYNGNFAAFVGENITSIALSDEMFSLSDNFIEIEISVVIGENPIIIGTETPFLEIPSGQEMVVELEPNMSTFLDYETAYILFDVDGVTIIDILYPDDNFTITLPELDMTPLTGELLSLSTIAYTGTLLLVPGGQANSSFLPNATDVTDGCFDVAETNISISVIDELGGLVEQFNPDIDMPTATKEQVDVSLRPNPVVENMEVTFPTSFVDKKTVLNIFSMSGELILKKVYNAAPTQEVINVKHFPQGTYVLQVHTNFSARSMKFLKL